MRDHRTTWAKQAASNALSVLPFLVEPHEGVPLIDIADIAGRIEAVFHDRAEWNQAVMESGLDGSIKLWLIVP